MGEIIRNGIVMIDGGGSAAAYLRFRCTTSASLAVFWYFHLSLRLHFHQSPGHYVKWCPPIASGSRSICCSRRLRNSSEIQGKIYIVTEASSVARKNQSCIDIYTSHEHGNPEPRQPGLCRFFNGAKKNMLLTEHRHQFLRMLNNCERVHVDY